MAGKSKKNKRTDSPRQASKKKTNQQSSNTSNWPTEYRKFDVTTSTLCTSLIKSCTSSYFAHVEENNGKCKRDFMAELVNSVNEKASSFDITRNAINNEIRRIRKRGQDEEKKNKA